MSKIKAAVIGLGRIGWWLEANDPLREKPCTHVGAYLENPEINLVAVCDTDPQRLDEFNDWIKQLSSPIPSPVATYSSYIDMMMKEEPDIVSVATPTDTHESLVNHLASSFHGLKAIFCEKPICDNPVYAPRMIHLCKISGVSLAINHTRRWDPFYRDVKRRIDEGEIGEVLSFLGRYSSGAVREGVHMADLGLWYGAKEIHLVNIPSPYLVFEADIYGSEGNIGITDNGDFAYLSKPWDSSRYMAVSRPIQELKVEEEIDLRYNFSDALMNAVHNLVGCVKNGQTPACTGEDGLKALEEVMKCYP